MCRMLFAYLPDSDADRALVLRTFLRLAEEGQVPTAASPGHHDGWGIAAYSRGELLRHFRSEGSGATDPLRDEQLSFVAMHKPDALLAHIRKRTVGEPTEHNSHPFVAGKYAFIHNGTLGATAQDIFGPVRDRSIGQTDSELYFHLVIQDLDLSEEHGKEKVESDIARTVRALRTNTAYQGGGFTSASSILTDGRYAYVLREFDEAHPFVKRSAATSYYTLYLGQGGRGERIICSEQLPIPDFIWSLLPNHSLTTFDLTSGAYQTREV